jgi:hypothetical protein
MRAPESDDGASPEVRPTLCPSASRDSATVVLGVAMTTGEIAYASPRVTASPDLLAALSAGLASLESRYRLAGPCAEARCGFWSGTGCSLGEELARSFAISHRSPDAADVMPKCSIRAECRWFAEQGRAACHACPHVITDTRFGLSALTIDVLGNPDPGS